MSYPREYSHTWTEVMPGFTPIVTDPIPYAHGGWHRYGDEMRGSCLAPNAMEVPNLLPAGFQYDYKTLAVRRREIQSGWYDFEIKVKGWSSTIVTLPPGVEIDAKKLKKLKGKSMGLLGKKKPAPPQAPAEKPAPVHLYRDVEEVREAIAVIEDAIALGQLGNTAPFPQSPFLIGPVHTMAMDLRYHGYSVGHLTRDVEVRSAQVIRAEKLAADSKALAAKQEQATKLLAEIEELAKKIGANERKR